MTKCTDIQKTLGGDSLKNPIQFIKYLNIDCEDGILEGSLWSAHGETPSEWTNITLLYRTPNHDVMCAWYDEELEEGNGSVFIGHWNDGVV